MISIGLPAYKSRYLKEAIVSVLEQTYTDFELIIVNDASPENIRNIVQSFNDSRIKYFENEKNIGNINLVENWNKVLSYATGEYFVLFSDDDVYEPTFLEEMYALITKYPEVDIAHCRVRIINDIGEVIDYSPGCPEYENVIDFIWHRLKGYRLQYAPDFMVRTSKLKKIGGFVDFPLAWSSDDATWFMLAKENGIVFLNKPLVNWRRSDYNLSNIGNAELRIKANIFYNEWLFKFVDELKIHNEDEKLKLKQIKLMIDKWKKNNITNILVRTSGNNFFSIIKIFRNWLKFKKLYKLDTYIFIKALVFKFKQLLSIL